MAHHTRLDDALYLRGGPLRYKGKSPARVCSTTRRQKVRESNSTVKHNSSWARQQLSADVPISSCSSSLYSSRCMTVSAGAMLSKSTLGFLPRHRLDMAQLALRMMSSRLSLLMILSEGQGEVAPEVGVRH